MKRSIGSRGLCSSQVEVACTALSALQVEQNCKSFEAETKQKAIEVFQIV